MTEQEQIEEIAKLIKSVKLYGDDNYERKISYDSALELAKYFYNAEYRKIPEGAVVLTKEECDNKVILNEDHFERALNYEREKARKETAKEFAEKLKERCHNYYPSIDHYCCSVKAINVKDINELLKEYKE